MKSLLKLIPFLAAAVYVVSVHGNLGAVHRGLDLLTLWNVLPIVIACLMVLLAQGNRTWAFGCWCFALVACGFMVMGHLAWAFDWGEVMSGSSTSALHFLLLPVPAFFFGVIALGLGVVIPEFRRLNRSEAGL